MSSRWTPRRLNCWSSNHVCQAEVAFNSWKVWTRYCSEFQMAGAFYFGNCSDTWQPSIYGVTCGPRIPDGREYRLLWRAQWPNHESLMIVTRENKNYLRLHVYSTQQIPGVYTVGQFSVLFSFHGRVREQKTHKNVSVNSTTPETASQLGSWWRQPEPERLAVCDVLRWVTVTTAPVWW